MFSTTSVGVAGSLLTPYAAYVGVGGSSSVLRSGGAGVLGTKGKSRLDGDAVLGFFLVVGTAGDLVRFAAGVGVAKYAMCSCSFMALVLLSSACILAICSCINAWPFNKAFNVFPIFDSFSAGGGTATG